MQSGSALLWAPADHEMLLPLSKWPRRLPATARSRNTSPALPRAIASTPTGRPTLWWFTAVNHPSCTGCSNGRSKLRLPGTSPAPICTGSEKSATEQADHLGSTLRHLVGRTCLHQTAVPGPGFHSGLFPSRGSATTREGVRLVYRGKPPRSVDPDIAFVLRLRARRARDDLSNMPFPRFTAVNPPLGHGLCRSSRASISRAPKATRTVYRGKPARPRGSSCARQDPRHRSFVGVDEERRHPRHGLPR